MLTSRFALGLMHLPSWNLGPDELGDLVEGCLDAGVTTFDHADIYGDYTCERRFGEMLARRPALRDRMQIVTKCGIKLVSENRPEHALKHYDTSREHLVGSVDASLAALRTDRADLLLIHRPDPLLNADEVAEAFDELRRGGKVLAFGVSNFSPAQFRLLNDRIEHLAAHQVQMSALHLDPFLDGTLDQCQRHRAVPMAWSPLAGGRLFAPDGNRAERVRAALSAVGEEIGATGLDQVAYSWLLRHPAGIVPVLGTGKLERVRTAVEAAELTLSRQQWFAIWTASTGHEVP